MSLDLFRNYLKWTAFTLLLAAGGCARAPRGEVEGTARTGDKPLAGVTITFVPDPAMGRGAKRAAAVTDEGGRFRLKCEGGKVGVPAGSYTVIFEDMAIFEAERSADGTVINMPPQRFPPSYADPLHTPFHRDIKAGTQTIDLDLGAVR